MKAEQPSGPQGPATNYSGPVYSDGMSSTQSNSTATVGQASDKPRTYTRSQMAAIKCQDDDFIQWLAHKLGEHKIYREAEMDHPIQIITAHNAQMRCWEVAVQAGNFPTKEAAQEYARKIKMFLEENAAGEFVRPQ